MNEMKGATRESAPFFCACRRCFCAGGKEGRADRGEEKIGDGTLLLVKL
jgi:hypothetical protein